MKKAILVAALASLGCGTALCIGGNEAGGYFIAASIVALTFLSCTPKKEEFVENPFKAKV